MNLLRHLPGKIQALLTSSAGAELGVLAEPVRVDPTGVTTQPTRTATDSLQAGTAVLTPKFALISASTAGDTTVVSAVTAKRIRVLRYSLVASNTVTVTWKSGSTSISGAMAFAQYGGISETEANLGIMQTAVGEALVINLGGAITVGGTLTYVEV